MHHPTDRIAYTSAFSYTTCGALAGRIGRIQLYGVRHMVKDHSYNKRDTCYSF